MGGGTQGRAAKVGERNSEGKHAVGADGSVMGSEV